MGLFDIFSNSDANNAAQAQAAGYTAGYNQLVPLLNQGTNALQTNYTAGLQPFINNYNNAQGGVNQLNALLGINPSSPSGGAAPGAPGAPAAAAGGQTPDAAAAAPAAPGAPAGAAGGSAGPNGPNSMQQTLQSIPGYQFALNQGAQNVMRNQAATGQLNSGATNLDLQAQGQGLASQNYFNYVNALQPYLQSSNANAQGIGGLYSGLGNAINQNFNTQGAAAYGTQAGIGNAYANADYANLASSGAIWGALTGGLGSALKVSDERAKEDIEPVGELFDGQPVFRYRYKGSPRHEIGLIAQKVEEREPAAVVEFPSSLKAVNYRRATDMAAELGRFMKAA